MLEVHPHRGGADGPSSEATDVDARLAPGVLDRNHERTAAAKAGDRRRIPRLEIEDSWHQLGDEALEEALTELRDLAAAGSLRYGYQRRTQALSEVIDAQFVDVPAAQADQGESAEDHARKSIA